jgi:RNA polymerase sigma-70 factor (ECF subfamily)
MGHRAESKPATDEQLMTAFVNGSHEAFDELVNRYASKITNFVYRQVSHFATAEEIAQDTFLAVFRKKHTYKVDHRFSSWLYKIAVNMCRMHFRKMRSVPSTISIEGSREEGQVGLDRVLVDDGESPVETLSRRDTEKKLREAILSLPAKQRQVFTLSFYEGMSYEEIAGLVGCSPGTVASRKHAAVKRLAMKLRKLSPELPPIGTGFNGQADVPEC